MSGGLRGVSEATEGAPSPSPAAPPSPSSKGWSTSIPRRPCSRRWSTGGSRRSVSRGLKGATIESCLWLLRRFAEYTNEYPWERLPADLEDYCSSLPSGESPRALSTLRGYQAQLALFCDYLCDPRYGWAAICEERFGSHPVQICTDANRTKHTSDYGGDPRRRPFTLDELQALFDFADDEVDRIRSSGRKGALAALRDSALLKVVYAWGLRRREAVMLDVADLRPNGAAPAFGFSTHPALWLTERGSRVSPRALDERFGAYRDAVGLPAELDLHCLRHSYITHLVESGYPERFVTDQVGHYAGDRRQERETPLSWGRCPWVPEPPERGWPTAQRTADRGPRDRPQGGCDGSCDQARTNSTSAATGTKPPARIARSEAALPGAICMKSGSPASTQRSAARARARPNPCPRCEGCTSNSASARPARPSPIINIPRSSDSTYTRRFLRYRRARSTRGCSKEGTSRRTSSGSPVSPRPHSTTSKLPGELPRRSESAQIKRALMGADK